MNKNTIIGTLLVFGILFGYFILTKPSEEELKEKAKKQERVDSLRNVKLEEQHIQDSLLAIQQDKEQLADTAMAIIDQNDTATAKEALAKEEFTLQHKYGVFSGAIKGDDKDIVLENEMIKIKVSSKGGGITYAEIKNYQTYDSLPLVLFDKKSSEFSFLLNDQRVESKELYFEPVFEGTPSDSIYVSGEEKARLRMRLYPYDEETGLKMENQYMEFEYILHGNDYMLNFNLNMSGMSKYIAKGYSDISLTWAHHLRGMEKGLEQEINQSTVFYKYWNDEVDDLGLRSAKDESEELKTKVEWISHKQQFFSIAIVAEQAFNKVKVNKTTLEEAPIDNYLMTMKSDITVPLNGGDIQNVPMRIYFGPNKYNILKTYDLDFEQQIPLGWGLFLLQWINRYAVIPVFDFLSTFGWNIGIIILVLTILLKLVLFPIAYKTYQSSAKMRVLRPEVEEINQKFPKKEDAAKKQQATMALYKKAGANPMAGCLPMLLQMPILIAMFRFFPASIELRQKAFLWADDLSSYDSIWDFPNGFEIPFYGDHVSLFTLLMTVTTIFYTRLNNQMMGSTQQMPGMKTMMYLMPIMFLGFFNKYAAGLSYYYFLANVITFTQMFAFRFLIDENKIRAKIQANKQKPAKKPSNFQKRLEEMTKQQQAKRR